MATNGDGNARHTRWLHTVWLRASLLNPLLFIGPWIGLCLLVPDSDLVIGLGFWAIPASAVVNFLATLTMTANRPLRAWDVFLLIGLGLAGSGAGLVVGFVVWSHAAEINCHGAYECPF